LPVVKIVKKWQVMHQDLYLILNREDEKNINFGANK